MQGELYLSQRKASSELLGVFLQSKFFTMQLRIVIFAHVTEQLTHDHFS